MPLANIELDLGKRENIGWALYYLVLLCILYNTVILLIRGISFYYDYIKKKKELGDFILSWVDYEDEEEQSVRSSNQKQHQLL